MSERLLAHYREMCRQHIKEKADLRASNERLIDTLIEARLTIGPVLIGMDADNKHRQPLVDLHKQIQEVEAGEAA